jgi:hypothetical protein
MTGIGRCFLHGRENQPLHGRYFIMLKQISKNNTQMCVCRNTQLILPAGARFCPMRVVATQEIRRTFERRHATVMEPLSAG